MHSDKLSGKNFLLVTILNVTITIVEILGGLFSGSLALLSDAFHNLGDSFSIVLGYIAQLISHRPESKHRTFGYRRAEILSALTNGIFLVVVAVFLIIEALRRFAHPQHIKGGVMLTVAIIGLLANLISAWLLHRGSHDSLNIKATYLHVLSDALSSIAVIIGAIIMMFFKVEWLDPVLTIAVSIYISFEAWPIIKQTIGILMQSSPDLDFIAIKEDIVENVPGVTGIHHVHAWQIDEHRIIFSAHINCDDMMLSDVDKIYDKIGQLLETKYHICHVTLQAECNRGSGEKLFNTQEDQQQLNE